MISLADIKRKMYIGVNEEGESQWPTVFFNQRGG